MDSRLVCLIVLLFPCGQLLRTSYGQDPQNKDLALCTDDCLCWKELDNEADAISNEQCVRLCDPKDKTFCQPLENCRCDLSKAKQLICRNNGLVSKETRYGCQEEKNISLIRYIFKVLWYLPSQLLALLAWLLRTIWSVLQFLVSLLFKLLSWAFWLLEVLLSAVFSLIFYLGLIAAIGLACYLLYRLISVQHVEEVEVHRRIVIERTIYL